MPAGRPWKMISLLVRLCPALAPLAEQCLEATLPQPLGLDPRGPMEKRCQALPRLRLDNRFRPWPPWRVGQLAPQDTLLEERGKWARGQPLLGLPVHGTWLGQSAPLSPEPAPLCRAAIPLQGRPLGEAGASRSWAALPTDHGWKATQPHCLPRACPPLPAPCRAEIPAGEAPWGGRAVAVSEGRKGGGGTEPGCEGEGRQAIEAPERMNSMGEPGSAEEAASSPGVARRLHLKCGAGRHARRPGRGTHKAREGCSRTRGLEGACLEACRVTAHQHLSGFVRVGLAAHPGLVNKGQSGKHQQLPACPEGTTGRGCRGF